MQSDRRQFKVIFIEESPFNMTAWNIAKYLSNCFCIWNLNSNLNLNLHLNLNLSSDYQLSLNNNVQTDFDFSHWICVRIRTWISRCSRIDSEFEMKFESHFSSETCNLKFCFQQQFNFIKDPEADLTVTSNMRFEWNIFCCKFKWILDGALYLDFGAR